MLLDVYGHFMPTETRGFADAITTPNGPQTAPLALPDTNERRVPSRNIVYPQGKTGADGRTRTADLLITNQLLYQLSYVGSAPAGGPRGRRS